MSTSLKTAAPDRLRSSTANTSATRSATVNRLLRGLAAYSTGVMAGFFWSFSVLVMPGLAKAEPLAAMGAMQRINDAVENPVFFLGFFGTPILCVIAAVPALRRRDDSTARLVLAGSAVYLVGVLGVTVAFNIPLNDDLARLDPTVPANGPAMATYIEDWSVWNDVRTYAGLVSCALFVAALFLSRDDRA